MTKKVKRWEKKLNSTRDCMLTPAQREMVFDFVGAIDTEKRLDCICRMIREFDRLNGLLNLAESFLALTANGPKSAGSLLELL